MEFNEIKDKLISWIKKNKKLVIQISIVLAAVIAVIILAVIIKKSFKKPTGQDVIDVVEDVIKGEEGKVTTISEATIKSAISDATLYTAEYPYSGYVSVKDANGDIIKYYVSYSGKVKAGIDVSKINIVVSDLNHTITVRLPEAQVSEYYVDTSSLDYIFTKDKYNDATVATEAIDIANADLKERMEDDPDLKKTATENAKSVTRSILQPWISQVYSDTPYKVVVLGYGEGAQ